MKKILMMDPGQPLHIISTVCPDYANNGQTYTFSGTLGSGISLTAWEHIRNLKTLLLCFEEEGFRPEWKFLVADLPEIVEEDFVRRVSGSTEEYLSCCSHSVSAIQEVIGSLATVETFSDFYEKVGIDYLAIQRGVAKRIRIEGQSQPFRSKFESFAWGRAELAAKFRGVSRMSVDDILEAGAHGMSLYVTHGTLLRHLFFGKNLVVINHETPNLQNFYLANLVEGYEDLLKTPKFPLGVLQKKFY